MSDKAIQICAEYVKYSQVIRKLGKDIGEALSKCRGVNGDLLWPEDNNSLSDFVFSQLLERQNKDETHLKAALTPDQGDYGSVVYMAEQEITEFVSECPHCTEAWKAIQQRKAARKAFGIVKRQISAIGRTALAKATGAQS